MEESPADAAARASGRPRVDLEAQKAEIIGLFENKMSSADICKHLKAQHDIQISSRTMTKRLQRWGVKEKKENNTSNQVLHARIKHLFFEVGLSDQEIITVLHDEGYEVSQRTLRRLRHQLGIRLRLDSPAQQQAQVQEILDALTEELDKGTIEGYGKELLHNHFRSKGYVFARDRLYNVYRMLRPDNVERRTSDFQRRPPPPKILAGPNLTWHVNGYTKLANFGFRIHAEIDSFSRFVLWINVGVDAHTATGVLKHHLESVTAKARQPRTLRSDLESEVPLLADAHFTLRRATEPNVQRDQCCAPGRANDTHRIESWWAQLAKSVVTLYHVRPECICIPKLGPTNTQTQNYFRQLHSEGLFSSTVVPEQVALFAIYMPILRSHIQSYVQTWNMHNIRKQANHPERAPGKPFMNFHHPPKGVENFGLPVDTPTVQAMQQTHTAYDTDEYLPPDTMRWCEAQLQDLGFDPLAPPARLPGDLQPFRSVYLALRERAWRHDRLGAEPKLALCMPGQSLHGYMPQSR
ncbi:unnamed protein product [Penicillium salamii]|uniref:Clr5 domain-containing protein n=1 Tax=Penicillium salamii TaxID=1612424 RepID=A0A9W4JI38_9EURO|nr:unnamed protein product [Penicillium salamii]CAG8208767.1 unnamed protein product [Penicillium salamii]CAG8229034.1 unnamed protein product [Penicillium salamii]CAG8243282.1 unnamed protein product [Penicillium salamii]CAG8392726.1 unnamed protein product [Penicillium salamii]